LLKKIIEKILRLFSLLISFSINLISNEKFVFHIINLSILPFAKIFINKKPSTTNLRVLHVSLMTTKPYIIVKNLRKFGIKASYLAIGSSWLKVGEKGADFVFVPYYNKPYLKALKESFLLWKMIRDFDIFHFHYNVTLNTDFWDLKFIKWMEKKIIFHFRGCDIRQKEINMKKNKINCCMECDYPKGACENSFRYKKIALAKKYGDLFL